MMRVIGVLLLLFWVFVAPARADGPVLKDGWDQLYSGDFDTAEKTFTAAKDNPATSAEAEWGLGLVAGAHAHMAAESDAKKSADYLSQSVAHLEAAQKLSPANARITTDLAYSYTMLGHELVEGGGSDGGNFDKARALYKQAENSGTPDPQALQNRAVLELYSHNAKDARDYWKMAKDLGARDPSFDKAVEEAK
jgi:hypothetical protein